MEKIDFKIYKNGDLESTATIDITFGKSQDQKIFEYMIKEDAFIFLEPIINKSVLIDRFYGPNYINADQSKEIIKHLKLLAKELSKENLNGVGIRKEIGLNESYSDWESLCALQKDEIINFYLKFIEILKENFNKNDYITLWGV